MNSNHPIVDMHMKQSQNVKKCEKKQKGEKKLFREQFGGKHAYGNLDVAKTWSKPVLKIPQEPNGIRKPESDVLIG